MTIGTLPGIWSPPPRHLSLETNEVHVWRASSNLPGSHVEDLRCTLGPSEQARADLFSFARDRGRFIARQGLLRVILGQYVAMAPGRLHFTHGAGGKPALAPECRGADLRFNVSSSAGLILYAITRGREIGIDLEAIRPAIAQERIPEHFFSPPEVARLRALPPDAQAEAFFVCWTRKEAYVKARGEGLARGLDWFEVSFGAGEPAALLRADGDAQEASRWSLESLAPGPGYAAALAVEGQGWTLTCWQWTPQ
jgi:4'-phosphopantetheinyl transferase